VDAQDETNASDLSIGLGVLSAQSNNRGYGAYWIVLAGLDYARARVLNAIHGGWTTRDPSGYKDSWNSYQYVSGTPIRSVDPYGRYRIAAPGVPDQDPNKQQRPISDADCCELAFGTPTNPLNSEYLGLLVCCNGIATICINPWLINGTPTSYEGQFYQCVYGHEKYHKDNHPPDCFGKPNGESPPSNAGQELEALKATRDCLEDIDCSTDPSCDKKKTKQLERNLRKQRKIIDPEAERIMDELRKLGPVG
jgi:RHS repeat-associated protein